MIITQYKCVSPDIANLGSNGDDADNVIQFRNKKTLLSQWREAASRSLRVCMLAFTMVLVFGCGFALADNVSVTPQAAKTNQQNTEKNPMGERRMSDEEVKQRGKGLHAAIEQRYKELEKKPKTTLDYSVNDVAMKYIPIGTSFEDVKEIIANAGTGYYLDEGKNLDGKLNPDLPHPYAMGTNMILSETSISSTVFSMLILPKIPGNFQSTVGEIQTHLVFSGL